MFDSNEHEKWVNEMLDNPEAKPVFEEFLDVRGKSPPPFVEDAGDDLPPPYDTPEEIGAPFVDATSGKA